MNRVEIKKAILAAIPKQILRLTVGYGINQRGACCRTGSLESFDHQFKNLKETQIFEEEMFESGYGNTLRGVVEVTIWDEIESCIEVEESETAEEIKTISWNIAIEFMEGFVRDFKELKSK